jgi:hypothetical protein
MKGPRAPWAIKDKFDPENITDIGESLTSLGEAIFGRVSSPAALHHTEGQDSGNN